MFSNALFCLKGMGYLYEIIRENNEVIAKINVIHQFNSGSQHSDDVWINCIVKDKMLMQFLLEIESERKLQKTIIISFDVAYCNFDYNQAGMTEEDPVNIVHFKGVLQNLRVQSSTTVPLKI